MVTFKGGWDKLYYTQHTLLNNGGQLPLLFFEKLTHTHRGRGKGVLFGYYIFAFVLLLITLHLICFPLLKWSYGGGWVALHLNFTQPPHFWSYILLLFSFFFFNFCLEMREIKIEQKYIFTLIFNKDGLQKANDVNLRWAKLHFSSHK